MFLTALGNAWGVIEVLSGAGLSVAARLSAAWN